jgi:hypothetical protein
VWKRFSDSRKERPLNLTLETDPECTEVDNRPLAGLPFDFAARRYPQPAFRNP